MSTNDNLNSVNEPDGDEGGVKLLLGAFLNVGEKVDGVTRQIAKGDPKPLRYKVFGSSTADGNSPFLIPALSHPQGPASGRAWNVLSIGLYGTDGHTALTTAQATTIQGSGSVTTPAAGATIASVSLPAGTWSIGWSALPSGTLAVADNNNLRLQNVTGGTTILSPLVFDASPSPTQTEISAPIVITLTQTSTIAIQAIALATTGAVYTANIIATPVSASGAAGGNAQCDLYVGKPPYASGAALDPIIPQLTDLVPQPDNLIPVTALFSKRIVWAKHGEIPYALVYNVPNGTVLTVVASVEDYALADVEALSI